jgi:hypothetical protein
MSHEAHNKCYISILTHICHDMTRPPRIFAGVFSAAKTGEVDALGPIPRPRSSRQTFLALSVDEIDERQNTYKELRPGLAQTRSNNGQGTKDSTEEQSSTTTEIIVERVRKPAAKEGRTKVRAII